MWGDGRVGRTTHLKKRKQRADRGGTSVSSCRWLALFFSFLFGLLLGGNGHARAFTCRGAHTVLLSSSSSLLLLLWLLMLSGGCYTCISKSYRSPYPGCKSPLSLPFTRTDEGPYNIHTNQPQINSITQHHASPPGWRRTPAPGPSTDEEGEPPPASEARGEFARDRRPPPCVSWLWPDEKTSRWLSLWGWMDGWGNGWMKEGMDGMEEGRGGWMDGWGDGWKG